MSKLTLKVHLVEVNTHTRKPLAGIVHEVEIDADMIDPDDLGASLLLNLPDIDAAARKNIASRRVDYDSFGGDSEYMDMVDRVAGDFYTAAVEVAGAVRRTYVAEGLYPDRNGLWSDEVTGVNAEEASFQAAWTMAENAAGTVERNIGPDTAPEQSIERMTAYIDDLSIESVSRPRLRKEDILAALRKLCKAARAHGIEDDALYEAEALACEDRTAAEEMDDDRIIYLDAGGEAAPSI